MIKLLKGDFIRLLKSKIFWLGVIFMFGIGAFSVYHISTYSMSPDMTLMSGVTMYIGVVVAVFIGFFIGTDYAGGAIRRKISMGFSRTAVYFSYLIICLPVSVIMHIIYIAVMAGAVALGITNQFNIMTAEDLLSFTLVSTCSVLAMAAITLLVCMLISNRTVGAVTAIVLSLIFIFMAQTVQNSLTAEIYHKVEYPDGTGAYEFAYPDDNPSTKRIILRFVHDFLPEDQLFQLSNGAQVMTSKDGYLPPNKEIFPIYSLSLIALSTTAGIIVFRKKDLK